MSSGVGGRGRAVGVGSGAGKVWGRGRAVGAGSGTGRGGDRGRAVGAGSGAGRGGSGSIFLFDSPVSSQIKTWRNY